MSDERSSIHSSRYRELIAHLVELRHKAGKSQSQVATALNLDQPDISKIENFERRLDALEFLKWIECVSGEKAEAIRRALNSNEPQ